MPRIISTTLLLLATISAVVVAGIRATAENPDQSPSSRVSPRVAVLEAMKQRPTDPWPRGSGHVILAPPGSRGEWKSYVEPGGSLSPTVGSFGLSIWVADAQGRLLTTSDALPLHLVEQSFRWGSRSGHPEVLTKTPYYVARYRPARFGRWELDFGPSADRETRVILALRSVGPAGAPVRSLEWDGKRLRLSDRWSMALSPPPTAVRLGEEGSPGWFAMPLPTASAQSWKGDDGWGYAALALDSSAETRVEIYDSYPMAEPGLWYESTRSALELNLPEPRFANSLDAQVAHLMMGLVGRETRPGDPTNYPLAWLRDGAYTVVALARAGQRAVARQLSTYFAENDFFGGFGPEADGPGLALWAMEEVSIRQRDHEFDEWLWPHVFRKAELILEMLQAKQPLRRLVRGPIVPDHWNHPELSLVSEPAHDGLIVGRMDWHRPLLFVNAVSYRGLLSAAALAERQGHRQDAKRWRGRAAELQAAWVKAFKPPESENDRTYISGLWPTGVASRTRELFQQGLEARWSRLRTSDGRFRQPPLWTYFEVADAHQWLFLGQPERTWKTLHWFWENQAAPGLYTWWEGRGEENTFGLWENVRGWVNPPHVTPQYWTGAEMLLLQIDMLAYVDESASEPAIVIGAGIPAEWLSRPMSVRGILTRLGQVDWKWDGRAMQVTLEGVKSAIRLGPSFPSTTTVKVNLIRPKWMH